MMAAAAGMGPGPQMSFEASAGGDDLVVMASCVWLVTNALTLALLSGWEPLEEVLWLG